ncbi:hypothetical protein CLAIMM_05206 [Cladophialophora immunda]|nr:hypothetical protein CLAIMM_05206 [Cladophialophora immunda]
MRLINTDLLTLEAFMGTGSQIPKYAILSHTWQDEEVTFQDFADRGLRSRKKGFHKIQVTCDLAKKNGIKYAWVDTCCIDKSSSAELTEAINSMFQWYKDAAVCYVWLSDLPSQQPPDNSLLKNCRWFSRGWTLQELLAPPHVEFYDAGWVLRGTKPGLSSILTQITRIEAGILGNPEDMYSLSIAQRMSWAATRQTTRVEDMAYCLLGIFNINMPMLYGEGPRAFVRLQEEIAKGVNDLSLFAWRTASARQRYHGVFATTPADFQDSGAIQVSRDIIYNPEFFITNKGLRINTSIYAGRQGAYFLGLNCSDPKSTGSQELGIWIKHHGGGVYSRTDIDKLPTMPLNETAKVVRIFVSTSISAPRSRFLECSHEDAFIFRKGFNETGASYSPEVPFEAYHLVPAIQWDSQQRSFLTRGAPDFAAYAIFQSTGTSGAEDEELMGGQMFMLAFGRTSGQDEPWIVISSPRDDPQGLWGQIGDAGKVAAVARGVKNQHMILTRDGMNYIAKAVHVSLERARLAGETVYYIDLEYKDAPDAVLWGKEGSANNPRRRKYYQKPKK